MTILKARLQEATAQCNNSAIHVRSSLGRTGHVVTNLRFAIVIRSVFADISDTEYIVGMLKRVRRKEIV